MARGIRATPRNRTLLAIFGALMLWAWLAQTCTQPLARYVSSDPEPGATLTAAPSTVIVTFSDELGPESTIDVTQAVAVSSSGDTAQRENEVTAMAGVDANWPTTLRAALEPGLEDGIYLVEWRVFEPRGNAQRTGSFRFGVGVPVPEGASYQESDEPDERNTHRRRRRAPLVAGLLLIGLAVIIPYLPRRG